MGERIREIKFRAWNGKEMFNVDVLAMSPCTWDCPDYGKRGASLAYQPHIKVMQYTGLNDKNGKGIYEGDVINLYCDCDPGDYAYCTHPPSVHKVVWNEEESGYDLVQISKGKVFEDFSSYMEESWEVIGNIYENPELLEVS